MTEAIWSPAEGDHSDAVYLSVRDGYSGPSEIGLWAGGELDPAYLTPAGARLLADELPALLRDFADKVEALDASKAHAPR